MSAKTEKDVSLGDTVLTMLSCLDAVAAAKGFHTFQDAVTIAQRRKVWL